PGDIKYVDQNGDGIVDVVQDRVRDLYHPTIPEIIYGFGLNAGFKGFYASAFFQGTENVSVSLTQAVGGRSVVYVCVEDLSHSVIRQQVINKLMTEKIPSENVFYLRVAADASRNSHVFENITWWHRDASYLRLKDVEVGYMFLEWAISIFKMRM